MTMPQFDSCSCDAELMFVFVGHSLPRITGLLWMCTFCTVNAFKHSHDCTVDLSLI